MSDLESVLITLQSPKTIRERSHQLLAKAKNKELSHFIIDESKITSTAEFIVNVIKNHYPTLKIPYHSRWRHFEMDNIPRMKQFLDSIKTTDNVEQATILFELVILSVFLDAGAGATWSYKEPLTHLSYSRSEGLALASLNLYLSGILSNQPQSPYRVDALPLIHFNPQQFTDAFQISSQNMLQGIDGRIALLNSLGRQLQRFPEYFGETPRLGNFFHYVYTKVNGQKISASELFLAVLSAFNAIWPHKSFLEGHALGDVWPHQALKTNELGSEFLPFHKLSQWLTYSLIEPLEHAGIEVTDLDELTGLPEYRNGGLLIDSGLLVLKNPEDQNIPHHPNSELIIEWRGLTVALLDELAHTIRDTLQLTPTDLPLAKILQGGTWQAGRDIAKQKRRDGTPPLSIISDGTIF